MNDFWSAMKASYDNCPFASSPLLKKVMALHQTGETDMKDLMHYKGYYGSVHLRKQSDHFMDGRIFWLEKEK